MMFRADILIKLIGHNYKLLKNVYNMFIIIQITSEKDYRESTIILSVLSYKHNLLYIII